MNNEIGRKITSLTIMTIMIAGGMTIAAPGMMPSAEAANQLLFVSAENATFGNTFGGGQIVEIIVQDPEQSATDVQESAPTVEVNGDTVAMVQGADGYWYAYIADITGLDAFNDNVNATTGATVAGLTANTVADMDSDATVYHTSSSLVAGAPSLSPFSGTSTSIIYGGQSIVLIAEWPFIQAFDFSSGNAEVILEKAGADEIVSLSYENLEDYAFLTMDRTTAPIGANVHLTIGDPQLNIDPTTEDTITFVYAAAVGSSTVSWSNNLTAIDDMYVDNAFGDNGRLAIDVDAQGTAFVVLENQTTLDDTDTQNTAMVFKETGASTGIFTNTDKADTASLNIISTADRGTTATIDYNDNAVSLTVGTYGGSLDMDVSSVGDEWNSGESMSVTLTDNDRNLNSASDETLSFANIKLPTIVTGSPVSADDGNIGRVMAATLVGGSDTLVNVTIPNIVALNTATGDNTGSGAGGTKNFVAVDVSDCSSATGAWNLQTTSTHTTIVQGTTTNEVIQISNATLTALDDADYPADSTVDIVITAGATNTCNIGVDFMSFGNGTNNGVYRMLLVESGDDTGVFEGTLEYIMLNQLNEDVIPDIATNSDSITMVLAADKTGSSAPRIKYADVDSDGQSTNIAAQADANTHNGVISFDQGNYKVADTVTVTLEDMDLNTNSSLRDVYTVHTSDTNEDTVGNTNGVVLEISIGGERFIDTCSGVTGLQGTGFTLVETDTATGIFTGTFQIPSDYCDTTSSSASTTGLDLAADYTDYLDASGNALEVGTAATITANSGSVSLDRQVYPVPWAVSDFTDHANVTVSGASGTDGTGSLVVTIAVTDEDYNTSPVGEDTIPSGKVVLKGYRGSSSTSIDSTLTLTETAADSGVFEIEVTIAATQQIGENGNQAVLKQGDILTVEYTDPTDSSGNAYLNTDSSTLDLRTGSLTSDKSVYVRGTDAILSIVDADLNLDSGTVENYPLNLVEWDSDAASNVNLGAETEFDPEPSKFRETGANTGVFQVVIEIPASINSTVLDSGEKIALEYVDYGTSGQTNYSASSTEDVKLTIHTSNFGATIDMDKKVYTWTDRVFVTITAPDHNENSGLVDEIGGAGGKLTAQTRSDSLSAYKLVETGPDTGIFFGEITLNGFAHDADGDGTNDAPVNTQNNSASGPTDGLLNTADTDGITVSFEYSEDATVISSSLIRWNVAETTFDEDAYLANSSAVVTVTDIDMNLNPDTVENFTVELWSDSDSGGIDLTLTETNESTGVFEGVVFFTTTDASSGHTLRVSEGDTITASYADHTLPEPYSSSDDLSVTSTAVIGTIIPPLERAPAANLRTVDAFGADLSVVSVDQQVQLQADIANGTDGEQSFAYLVQVQNDSGVTVSLAWITGTLTIGQAFSPALSWIPTESGSYTATAFVWESVSNPTALSASISTTITVE